MLGNKTDDAAVVTIDERTIKLAARAGEQLAYSDDAADELPDSQKIDLPPGKYKVTLKVDGSTAAEPGVRGRGQRDLGSAGRPGRRPAADAAVLKRPRPVIATSSA